MKEGLGVCLEKTAGLVGERDNQTAEAQCLVGCDGSVREGADLQLRGGVECVMKAFLEDFTFFKNRLVKL